MKAAVIDEQGALPLPGEFAEPTAQPGAILIDVDTAGLGGWARRFGAGHIVGASRAESAPEAWQAQLKGSHAKITAVMR